MLFIIQWQVQPMLQLVQVELVKLQPMSKLELVQLMFKLVVVQAWIELVQVLSKLIEAQVKPKLVEAQVKSKLAEAQVELTSYFPDPFVFLVEAFCLMLSEIAVIQGLSLFFKQLIIFRSFGIR